MQKCVVRNRGKGTLKVRGNEVTLNSAKLHHEKCEKRVYYKAVHGALVLSTILVQFVPGYWKNNWNVSVFRFLRASVVYV